MSTVVPDVGSVRIYLVDKLPEACGGGVARIRGDGVMCALLEPPRPDEAGADAHIDLAAWVDLGYEIMATGEPVTCADQARRFGVHVDVAHAAFWSFAWEWLQASCCAED